MQVRAVDFIGVPVADMDAAKEFYGGHLGLRQTSGSEGWSEYEAGNVTISLIHVGAEVIAARGAQDPLGMGGVALAVPDVRAALEELRQKGVQIVQETVEYPPCFMATLADPSGNYVWLHQRKDGTAG